MRCPASRQPLQSTPASMTVQPLARRSTPSRNDAASRSKAETSGAAASLTLMESGACVTPLLLERLLDLLCLLQVFLQNGQRLLGKLLHVLLLAALRLLFEQIDGVLVILHHLIHVGAVEAHTRQTGQAFPRFFVFAFEFARRRDAILRSELHQFLIVLAVVLHHAFGELFDLGADSLT